MDDVLRINQTIQKLARRLWSYSGPLSSEEWKYDEDLNHCTNREKEEMKKYGLTPTDFMNAGYNRGQVHHILFGYRFSPTRRYSQ